MTVETKDDRWDGPHGDLPVRIFADHDVPPRSGLVWVHGGSWMGGDLDMPESDWVGRSLAAAGIWTVSVDYRRAPYINYGAGETAPAEPGHTFPIAHDEIVHAFASARAHAIEIGIDADNVSLGGASAGGNLAAGAAMRIRDDGAPAPRSLLLLYPATHAVLPPVHPHVVAAIASLPPAERFEPEILDLLARNYAGEQLGNPYAFPGGHSTQGLPRTYILNSEFDSLRAGGEAFAASLALSGVDVLCEHEPGSFHGHLNRPGDPTASASIRRMVAWLRRDGYFEMIEA